MYVYKCTFCVPFSIFFKNIYLLNNNMQASSGPKIDFLNVRNIEFKMQEQRFSYFMKKQNLEFD